MPSPKHFSVQQTFSNEMYNCIQSSSPQTSPQHQQDNNDTAAFSSASSSPGSNSQQPYAVNGHSTNGNANGQPHNNNKDKGQNFERFEIDQNRNSPSSSSSRYDYDNPQDNNKQDDDRPSNENLLGTAFVTFMGFALIQTVVAYFAESEAMLGDSAAMIVDALTYLFNWCAERKKAQFNDNDGVDVPEQQLELSSALTQQERDTRQRILARTKRKMVLQLELAPPMISVSTLILVTIFVLRHSIKILMLDAHRSQSLQGNPKIYIMMGFSIANLFLDLVNVANFAKAKHLFGYETNDQAPKGHTALSSDEDDHGDDDDNNTGERRPGTPQKHTGFSTDDDYEEDQEHTANLNMCSAYTHVFADTLRSIAVLVAACLSVLVPEITPEEADASAAVVVSGLIILSLIPLFNGLVQTFHELRMIQAEEKSDEMVFSS